MGGKLKGKGEERGREKRKQGRKVGGREGASFLGKVSNRIGIIRMWTLVVKTDLLELLDEDDYVQ